jgi:hypothetical protein
VGFPGVGKSRQEQEYQCKNEFVFQWQ